MKDRPAYLPLYVRDYLTDPVVQMMRWIEQAIYLRMLMASWEAGPLPDNDELIVRLIGAQGLSEELASVTRGEEFDVHGAVKNVLEAAWVPSDAGWTNPRLEQERVRWKSIMDGNSSRTAAATAARRRRDEDRDEDRDEHRNDVRDGQRNDVQAQAQAQAQGNPQPTLTLPVGETTKKADPKKPEDVPIPGALDTPEFVARFLEFCAHRKARAPKDPWTPIAASRKLAQLEKLGVVEATRWVVFALDEGLKNIQEPYAKGAAALNGFHPASAARNGSLAPARGQDVWRPDAGCRACGHVNPPAATTCASCRRPLRAPERAPSLNGTH